MYPYYVICLRAHKYSLETEEKEIQYIEFLMGNQLRGHKGESRNISDKTWMDQ